jgi:hypothetical protein
MTLINRDARPEQSVYYAACCVLREFKSTSELTLDELYTRVSTGHIKNLDYSTLVLSIDFLFLLNKVRLSKEKIVCT